MLYIRLPIMNLAIVINWLEIYWMLFVKATIHI